MEKHNSGGIASIAKGLGLGIIVGGVVGAIGARAAHTNKNQIKKNVGRAFQNVGSVVEDVADKL